MRVREMADKRVLIVDDLSVIRGFVKAALRDLGVIVHEASDGSQALDLQDSFAADVIICDISMPGMNGEEFLTRLRDRGDTTAQRVAVVGGEVPRPPTPEDHGAVHHHAAVIVGHDAPPIARRSRSPIAAR